MVSKKAGSSMFVAAVGSSIASHLLCDWEGAIPERTCGDEQATKGKLTPEALLWTRDMRLHGIAKEMSIAYIEPVAQIQ